MKKTQKFWSAIVLPLVLVGLGWFTKEGMPRLTARFLENAVAQPDSTTKENEPEVQINPMTMELSSYDQQQYDQLAAIDFESSGYAVSEVNNGQATLDIASWQENKVIYGDLDELNRTTFVTAYIDQKNLGRSEGRERQVWQPTGWHQKKVDGEAIYNRGHLLAYTSSFNFDTDGNFKEGEGGSQDNPKNLATQTAFSNQKVQTTYEKLVRDAQKIEGNKVLFQIVTVFRGTELMPRGYWLQAMDRTGTLNFNVYAFNVQPNVVFNYEDGSSQIDRNMEVGWK